jgi:hypothetical protein
MAKLFVANASKQVQEFHYWAPDSRRPLIQNIQPGTQQQIWQEAPRDQLEMIVHQHEMYGIKPASELDRNPGYAGLVYAFDKPITTSRIEAAIEQNNDALDRNAQERRKEAALATDAAMDQLGEETGLHHSSLEVEIVEERRPDADTTVNETVAVEKPGSRSRRARG